MQSTKKKPKEKDRHVVKMLSIEKLIPTADNRRRSITKSSVESLAKSMSRGGVLQPIVVRVHSTESGCFEIRAGERRWHAAKLAKLTHLPAIVRTLDDQSALAVTLGENIERENFHPLEEASTIQIAFDRGYDIKALAAELGKPLKYLARRASLTRLSKVWQDEILKPDSEASRLSVKHLELIARLPEESQNVLAEGSFSAVFAQGHPTVEELSRIIDRGMHSLRAMPWKPGDDTLDPTAGSCLACPKRTGAQPILFDDEEAPVNGRVSKTDRCLDPACHSRKLTAHLIRCESDLRRHPPNCDWRLELDLLGTKFSRVCP